MDAYTISSYMRSKSDSLMYADSKFRLNALGPPRHFASGVAKYVHVTMSHRRLLGLPVIHPISCATIKTSIMTQGSYSRDITIKAILSFYNYFATLPSLSPSEIVEAPPGGWPEITPETLAALKKNDDVIDLLKHLPYLNSDVQIAYKTNAIDYRGTDIKWCIDKGELEGSIVPVGTGGLPNYVAVLSAGHRYGSWLLLDTRAGKWSFW